MVVKIGVNALAVGMYVVDTGLSWMEHPYLYSRQGRIDSEKGLQALRKEGYAEAFIDTRKSSFVRLSNSRHGLVWSSNARAPLSPTVKAVFDNAMRPIPVELVDLALCDKTSAGPPLSIAEAVDPRLFHIDMAAVMN